MHNIINNIIYIHFIINNTRYKSDHLGSNELLFDLLQHKTSINDS